MEHDYKLYAAKTVSWPGATPFPPPVCGPNPLSGLRGSRPATMHALILRVSVFCRVRAFKVGFKPSAGIESLQSTVPDHAAPQLFGQGDQRHHGHLFGQIYQDWATKVSPQPRSRPWSTPVRSDEGWPFKTPLLPESYDILDHVSINKSQPEVEPCVETLIPPMLPLRVPLPASANACKPRANP